MVARWAPVTELRENAALGFRRGENIKKVQRLREDIVDREGSNNSREGREGQ